MQKPNAGMRITKKDGLTFESNVDTVLYTLEELIHAANRDVGKYVSKQTANAIFESYKPNFVRGRRIAARKNKFKKTYANKSVQYWARKKELDVQIGYKHPSWMMQQERGEYNYPRLGLLRTTVAKSIPEINRIQSQYVKKMNDKKPDIPNGKDEGDGE